MSPQKLPLPRIVRTGHDHSRSVKYAALPDLLPQVLSWARSTTKIPAPTRTKLASLVEILFLNASHHAYGPVTLTLIERSQHTDLIVRDNGAVHGTSPNPGPEGGLATLERITKTWGWYGDHRGHTVWARLPLNTQETHGE